MPTLESDHVRLEPFSENFLSPAYIAWLNDPVVCRDNRHGKGDYTLQKASDYLTQVRSSANQHVFAILSLGKHVGNIGLTVHPANHSGEVGILIGEREAWGKGIGYEACKLLMDFGFNQLNLHRIYLGMTVRNRAMIRICEKLEMRHEGSFKGALLKDGIYLDTVSYAKINPNHET